MKTLTKLFRDDAGATAIEIAVTTVGGKLSNTFNSVATGL